MARTISAKLSERLGQQVVVDNRGGGSGNIAAAMTARAAPDGYTIFFGTISTLATNVSTFRKLPYDPAKDFAPVTLTAISPMFLVTHPSVPAASYSELLALARAKPREHTRHARVSATPARRRLGTRWAHARRFRAAYAARGPALGRGGARGRVRA
jgi:tripartite-type tricarboxylate transporter receptor subunit TctC